MKEKYLVQTLEEDERKGDREDEEAVNEDENGDGGEDTCKEGEGEEGEEDNHVLTIQL